MTVGHLGIECPKDLSGRVRMGSDEHRAKQKAAALVRWRHERGQDRHPNIVAPTLTRAPRTAREDTQAYSNRPGPSRLANGPSAAELIAWAAQRRRGA
jgi:hypothetical protein